jgi:hypothetical protein
MARFCAACTVEEITTHCFDASQNWLSWHLALFSMLGAEVNNAVTGHWLALIPVLDLG